MFHINNIENHRFYKINIISVLLNAEQDDNYFYFMLKNSSNMGKKNHKRTKFLLIY